MFPFNNVTMLVQKYLFGSLQTKDIPYMIKS